MNNVLLWEGIVTQLVAMGVKSFKTVKALMSDAGVDDATIAELSTKWDDLYDRVKRAAGE